jgi:signal transduction histidine kinase
MTTATFAIIYFFYGLAFFSMGLAILLESGRASDMRLRRALAPLAGFSFIHAAHEWLEMFDIAGLLHYDAAQHEAWEAVRLVLLAFSFLSLAAFGAALLARDDEQVRLSLLVPLGLSAVWGLGLLYLRGVYPYSELFDVADVWTRYTLAVPSAMIACVGLLAQQKRFRLAGMERFGQDALWAAIAFFWYGIIGQTFTRVSPLPPSNVFNQALFLDFFGFPVQLMRATAAGLAAIFVMRFMRSFEVERRSQMRELQAARLEEAERREALRGELLHRVVAAQEAERQRLARELHDETGQALTAIGLGLRGASSTLRQDDEKAAAHLRQLEGLTSKSLNELRRIIADLRPSHLDDLGLAATLRWYAHEVHSWSDLNIDFHVSGPPCDLSTELKTSLFRITQEALTNTVKHADASKVTIQLQYSPEDVKLQVRDDGIGFDPLKINHTGRPPWGLEGMRERAALLGGVVRVTSVIGNGTLVDVEFPCQCATMESENVKDSFVVD